MSNSFELLLKRISNNFGLLLKKISEIDGVVKLGTIESPIGDYPLFRTKLGKGKKVILSAGLHGDEPAGVYAILLFLEKYAKKYLDDFEFHIFPCVNPTGLILKQRCNFDGLNLNREFKVDTQSNETTMVMDDLSGEFVFTMDFHETGPDEDETVLGEDEPEGDDPTEFYFWETCGDKEKRIGRKIIKEIEALNFPVCKSPKIYGDTNSDGVIWYPESNGTPCYALGTSFDEYLYKHHTGQSFTIETPLCWEIEKRALAHVVALTIALEEIIIRG